MNTALQVVHWSRQMGTPASRTRTYCECLDHVIVLHERHLRRLLTGYLHYYHYWRMHWALDMDCPVPRLVQRPEVRLIREVPEVGGLHHHYERRAA